MTAPRKTRTESKLTSYQQQHPRPAVHQHTSPPRPTPAARYATAPSQAAVQTTAIRLSLEPQSPRARPRVAALCTHKTSHRRPPRFPKSRLARASVCVRHVLLAGPPAPAGLGGDLRRLARFIGSCSALSCSLGPVPTAARPPSSPQTSKRERVVPLLPLAASAGDPRDLLHSSPASPPVGSPPLLKATSTPVLAARPYLVFCPVLHFIRCRHRLAPSAHCACRSVT